MGLFKRKPKDLGDELKEEVEVHLDKRFKATETQLALVRAEMKVEEERRAVAAVEGKLKVLKGFEARIDAGENRAKVLAEYAEWKRLDALGEV